MGVKNYGVVDRTKDGKMKKLKEILHINDNLFRANMRLKVRVIKGDAEIGK